MNLFDAFGPMGIEIEWQKTSSYKITPTIFISYIF